VFWPIRTDRSELRSHDDPYASIAAPPEIPATAASAAITKMPMAAPRRLRRRRIARW
jgi:hypothetical protein